MVVYPDDLSLSLSLLLVFDNDEDDGILTAFHEANYFTRPSGRQ